MKYAIGDIVKHHTGITGEVIWVIRYRNGIIEYFIDYGNRCAWSMESSLKKGEAWHGIGDYKTDCVPCKFVNQTVIECKLNCPLGKKEAE